MVSRFLAVGTAWGDLPSALGAVVSAAAEGVVGR
jgi:hypothetical protein